MVVFVVVDVEADGEWLGWLDSGGVGDQFEVDAGEGLGVADAEGQQDGDEEFHLDEEGALAFPLKFEVVVLGVSLLEQADGLGDEILVFVCEVIFFGGVFEDVVEFDGCLLGLLVEVELDGFPLAVLTESNGAFAALLVEFPVEVVVFLLFFSGEGGEEGNAVEPFWDRGSGEFADGGKDVPVGGNVLGCGAGNDLARRMMFMTAGLKFSGRASRPSILS